MKPKITKQHRSNIATLAKGLMTRRLKTGFRMYRFSTHANPSLVKNRCGTTCCAAGHGPILVTPAESWESWHNYTARVFGMYAGDDTGRFGWLFGNRWPADKKQFAARAYHYLKTGRFPINHAFKLVLPVPDPSEFDRWIIPAAEKTSPCSGKA